MGCGALWGQNPQLDLRSPRALDQAPVPGYWNVEAATQTVDGEWRRLRGAAKLEGTDLVFQADEIDYNEQTGYIEARGNVRFKQHASGEEVHAARAEFWLDEERGKFYEVRGWGKPRIDARPGIMVSQNPFYFEGKWAERLGKKYILHDGFVTNCKIPNPWWRMRGPVFDIIPGDRAIVKRGVFMVRFVPIFFFPYFYKSLEKMPRKSGFLPPNFGNSSRRGKMFGIGYYWAINRSYDVSYRIQEFTQRGRAHNVQFRGKPIRGSDFNMIVFGVQDRGLKLDDGTRVKEGGASVQMTGESYLGKGFQARGAVNYLSSFVFRRAFTETFNEAIFSEVHSVGFVKKDWSYNTLNVVFARLENFQTDRAEDSIVVRKLPEIEFRSRDRKLFKDLPVWISIESAAGLIRRTQPLFQTRQFMERLDAAPRVMTAFEWKDFHIVPSFQIRETRWGERQEDGRVFGQNIRRNAREFDVALIAPSVARVFNKGWFLGDKLKHVIEPRASFRHVNGIDSFDKFVRFDETELLSNTTEAEFHLTNRLYAKAGTNVYEAFTWQIWHRRYFDPDFGGALFDGTRNVVRSQSDITAYAFFNGRRRSSPIVNAFRAATRQGVGLEWRGDYDPVTQSFVNSGLTVDARVSRYFISVGHNHVNTDTVLTPKANQFRGLVAFGDPNRKGWSGGYSSIYDFRQGVMQFASTQVTYNTDCCGFSVQFRRLGFRNENQIRLAFVVANIGSFGTLRRQERLF